MWLSRTELAMPVLNPWLLLILGALIVAGLGGSYVKGRSDGKAIEQAEQLTQAAIRDETLKTAQEGAAAEIAKIEVKHVTTRQQLETRIVEKPVYRDCVADDSVFALTNEAITGQPAAASDRVVPGTGSNDRKDVR
jgi:predicted RNase H-like nuclease